MEKKYNTDLTPKLESHYKSRSNCCSKECSPLKKCIFFRDNKVFVGSHKLDEIKK